VEVAPAYDHAELTSLSAATTVLKLKPAGLFPQTKKPKSSPHPHKTEFGIYPLYSLAPK
jgi:high-affinity Fe2+/Pb2+ permease